MPEQRSSLFVSNPIRLAVQGGGGSNNVTLDAAGTKLYQGTPGTSQSYTGITVGSGTHRALIVTLDFDGGNNVVSGVTAVWDSGGTNQSMTNIINDGSAIAFIFGLVAPTSGNKTLLVSWTGSDRIFIDAISFTNVDQTGGATSFPGAQQGAGISTLAISSAVGDMVVCTGGSGSPLGTVTGTTLFNDGSSGAVINAWANYDNGAATVNIGISGTAASIVACDVKAG